MVVVAKESREGGKGDLREEDQREKGRPWEMHRGLFEGRCYYCGEKGHFRSNCRKWKKDERVYEEIQNCKVEE